MKTIQLVHADYSILSFEGKLMSDADLIEGVTLLDNLSNWHVVLDLSKLAYVNSSGIAFFVKVLTRARMNQGDVVMLNVNEQLMKIFELTKINQVFQLVNTMSEVEAYFKK
ncbi:MAG: STAS domain-containing protein [Crocinitomicaceae bacterium]|jgi:anti-anti-sigma factor|nr:STAS domain-containing protein [Crocinitomicaceae bacterium]MDP4760154.1 STAS domain-containing protein [Crocinitomicaceae bacterium]